MKTISQLLMVPVIAALAGCGTTAKSVADYTNAPCSVINDRYENNTQTLRYHARESWEKLQKPVPMFTGNTENLVLDTIHRITREAIEERAAVLPHTKRCKTPLMELQEETLSILRPLPYWIEQK